MGYKPDIAVLVEPRVLGTRADEIIRKTGYPNSYRIEAHGFSGGIWMLWKDSVKVSVKCNHRQFIHSVVCNSDGKNKFLFTAIYGSPNPTLRERLWQEALDLQIDNQIPWLMAGDFNATVSSGERKGGAGRVQTGCKRFKSFIQNTGLVDLGYTGPQFTWKRGDLLVRLDRALCNQRWLEEYPNSVVMHLPRIQSDHRPLLIKQSDNQQKNERPFRFLASWTLHPGFKDLVTKSWKLEKSLSENLNNFSIDAQRWNEEIFGHIGRNKRKLRREITEIQRKLEINPYSDQLLKDEQQTITDYENVCLQEEMLWLQKSYSQWIRDGDRNTGYYHAKALTRRRKSRILLLR